jgi:hypothetical protein
VLGEVLGQQWRALARAESRERRGEVIGSVDPVAQRALRMRWQRLPEASTGWSPAVDHNLPTYRVVLTIPAGLDETRLTVVDDTSVIAETTWRPADNYQPGPATWDWRLHALGCERTAAWQPD